MSYPKHPKSDLVDRLLWSFAQMKEVTKTANVTHDRVLRRCAWNGLRRYWLTEEERRLVEAHRRKKGLIK